jgi:transposase-like protein
MTNSCIYCKKPKVIRCGWRTTQQRGKVQRYFCRYCKRKFCYDEGFRWKHKPVAKILIVLEEYINGLSSRTVSKIQNVSKNTVLRWIYEYATLLSVILDTFRQKMTDHLYLDELFLKMLNSFWYVWDSICRDTRYATIVLSPKRTKKDAEKLFKRSPDPTWDVTFDGAFQYPAVIKKLRGIRWYYNHAHRCKEFKDKKNNNIIERFQNFLRSKLKQRRGFKSDRTAQLHLNLLLVYYNFIRDHMSIEQTPAEKAGLIEYFDARSEQDRFLVLLKRVNRLITL